MKKLLIGLIALGSISTYAQNLSHGGVLKFEIDWQRTFDVLTLREYKSNKRAKLNHCKYMYQNLAETSTLLEDLIESREINASKIDFYLEIQDSLEAIADSSCKAALGSKKANSVKEAIITK